MKEVLQGIMLHEKKEPAILYIQNNLEELQGLVEGNIEVSRLGDGILAIINEEGRLIGMKPNPVFQRYVGPVYLIGEDGENFDDFPAEHLETFLEYCKEAYWRRKRSEQ